MPTGRETCCPVFEIIISTYSLLIYISTTYNNIRDSTLK